MRLLGGVLALAEAPDIDAVEVVEAYGRYRMTVHQRKIQLRLKAQIKRLRSHLRLLGIEFPLKD